MVGGGGRGEWGFLSHFHVQFNYSVEVVLCCRKGCDENITRRRGLSTKVDRSDEDAMLTDVEVLHSNFEIVM